MMNNEKKQSLWQFMKWFNPAGRTSGTFGFMINRIAGIGLTVYLFMHLIMLSKLISGKEAFDAFIKFAHNPIIVVGEFLVVFAVLLHGINGLRIALTSFGIGNRYQKVMLIICLILAVAGGIIFAMKMFGGD